MVAASASFDSGVIESPGVGDNGCSGVAAPAQHLSRDITMQMVVFDEDDTLLVRRWKVLLAEAIIVRQRSQVHVAL